MVEQILERKDVPDKNTAFMIFKSEHPSVKDFEVNISATHEKLKKNKDDAKEYLDKCNEFKARIEEIKNNLNHKKMSKFNEGVI